MKRVLELIKNWNAKRSTKATLGWLLVVGLFGCAAFIAYCAVLFQELEPLMTATPNFQPSTIYSDIFIVSKGAIAENVFLRERLRDLRYEVTETPTSLSWKSHGFEYPDSILAADSPMRTAEGQMIRVETQDARISKITVNEKELDAIALEPTPIAQIAGSKKEIRNYAKLDDIPVTLLQAIIAIEDQRFLEHPGFDVRSLMRAIWVNIKSRALSQGGSTLTQQLIKNLLGTRQKTLFRKGRELILALLLEAKYTKDVILEKYLNEVYFGQVGSLEIHGVTEAARYFFNKPLSEITLAETAMIAGVIRGPAVYSPYRARERALERKNTVLRKMAELEIITKEDLNTALAEKLSFAPISGVNNRAPYFVDYVKSQVLDQLKEGVTSDDLSTDGLRVFTTADLVLQRRADAAVATTIKDLEARFKIVRPLRLEGVLVVAENKLGFIRAIVGGRSYSETTFNRALNMKRQAGSTFKPFAYLAALQKGTDSNGIPYSGAYMVDDEPWSYKVPGIKDPKKNTWNPKNYEKDYRGHITLREAFANSINIPMAKVGVDVGIDRVVKVAHALGISEKLPEVASLSLGSIDVQPIELLQAYSTIANRGEKTELTSVRAIIDANGRPLARFIPNSERVFPEPLIDVLRSLLRSVVTEGTSKAMPALGYSKLAFGKTGTTSFSRDAWFAGFSQNLTAVAWTGFDELAIPEEDDEAAAKKFISPAPLTGAGAALPTWAKFFDTAFPSSIEAEAVTIDSSLERWRIDRTTGQLARPSCPTDKVYEELFLPGTAPSQECMAHK